MLANRNLYIIIRNSGYVSDINSIIIGVSATAIGFLFGSLVQWFIRVRDLRVEIYKEKNKIFLDSVKKFSEDCGKFLFLIENEDIRKEQWEKTIFSTFSGPTIFILDDYLDKLINIEIDGDILDQKTKKEVKKLILERMRQLSKGLDFENMEKKLLKGIYGDKDVRRTYRKIKRKS